MIQIRNLTKYYNKGKENEFCALKGVNLEIHDGEMVAVIGKSGAGKSTLLHILAGIDSYNDGTYQMDDIQVEKLSEKKRAQFRNKKIGIVMQDYALIDEYSVEENVQIPLIFGKVKGKGARREKVAAALNAVGLEDLAQKSVRQLSGGQKQRVAIARALVNEPAVLLADEPTGALDTKTSGEIIDVFCRLHDRGKTVVIVTHDMDVAGRCGRSIEIVDGCVKE